ncbi:MAG TPA: hypothetical protein DCM60_07090 [Nitrospina sp.]|nr:hypothetical protein [Nitrospina sp.]|tara:strand:+ start:318 stop:1445 length:1128 start_codon:yes stop_codon:yes gene_type:complete
MNHKYIKEIHKNLNTSDESQSLFEKIIGLPSNRREDILKDVHVLIEHTGLAYALLALYRQQVKSGFVLADPLNVQKKEEKKIFDPDTGVTFRMQWNPDRELRKNHELLIERGVIAEKVNETKLINRGKNGKACYLCKANIDAQNPGEILLDMDLGGEKYYAGANFAYITNNHYTILSEEHRPQQYRKNILEALIDFVCKTDGYFRAIFNGLAGASIKEHEHMQATTEEFPIERLKIENKDVQYENNDIRVSNPKYYCPIWVLEGTERTKTKDEADKIISKWHDLDEKYHTVNIIAAKVDNQYRIFIILRDRRKLAGKGKGLMASFEAGGSIVLSSELEVKSGKKTSERETFDKGNLETIKGLLKDITPEKQLTGI